jgi:antitoxin component YwqK of YwqJK toxin-antitoxin module
MKKILILFLFISSVAIAQKIPDYGFNKVRISAEDKTIQAELKPVKSDPDIETDRLYYWYSSNIIHTTQGGFSGKLLNGKYTEYYLNKNLKEQGAFIKGLKDGIWTNWDENGIITQFYTWKKGVKDGEFNLYNERGKLRQTGSYDNNLLDGKIKTYSETGSSTVIVYNDGIVVKNEPSKFWQKIKQKLNIFKKKNKSPKQDTKIKANTNK